MIRKAQKLRDGYTGYHPWCSHHLEGNVLQEGHMRRWVPRLPWAGRTGSVVISDLRPQAGWGRAVRRRSCGLGPAQMSCPLASPDSMVLTCQNVLRNIITAFLRILRVGERAHHLCCGGKFPHHLGWREKDYLTSWTASKPHRNWVPESRAKTGAWYQDPEQTIQARTQTLPETSPGQPRGDQKTSKA